MAVYSQVYYFAQWFEIGITFVGNSDGKNSFGCLPLYVRTRTYCLSECVTRDKIQYAFTS